MANVKKEEFEGTGYPLGIPSRKSLHISAALYSRHYRLQRKRHLRVLKPHGAGPAIDADVHVCSMRGALPLRCSWIGMG